ncbi:MAG: hypothetical protein DCC52_06395 [Chloroflexi bacterium]|nr:MAG: hypothetical protein DCC52_06395 [Chloroflexota bacterium]
MRALYARRPRARDVFDLWFILTHGADALDAAHAFALAQRIAAEKKLALRTSLDETHAALLKNTWAQVLKEMRLARRGATVIILTAKKCLRLEVLCI